MDTKKVIILPLSFILIIIGIIGLILPIMPGWIFIIVALLLLGVRKKDILREIKILKNKGPKKEANRLKRKIVSKNQIFF